MIILNAGVPRSGTVLVNAILRKLFEAAGVAFQQTNPHGAELPRLIHHLQQSGRDRHKTTLIHTHNWDAETARLLNGSPHMTGFANYRDPRDVSVSLMRLHDHDFETAAEMTEVSFRIFEATSRQGQIMVLPYELLSADRPGHIFRIARHLGFWPGLDQVARIAGDTSIEHHRKVMDAVNAGTLDTLAHRKNTNRVLVEDRATLINDRHIQSGVVGRWRGDLSSDLQRVANERFAPILKKYGYPAD